MAEEFRTPQSANEALLQNWVGADNELRAPQSRIEKLLLAILGEDVTPDPPKSVNEELLTQILEQGGGSSKLLQVVDRSVIEISERDLVGITTIGREAFAYCTNLKKVTIPNGVTEIDIGAFYNCYKLSEIIISNSVSRIRESAFASNRALKSITIPQSVNRIDNYAFEHCDFLEELICRAINPPSITSSSFNYVPENLAIYVPAGSVEAYKTARHWSDRADYIQAIPE